MKKLYTTITLSLISFSFYGQIVNIPDANFKQYLLTEITVDTDGNVFPDVVADSNGDGEIDEDEALQITYLIPTNRNITTLSGIEYFTNLIFLNFNNNLVTAVDLHTLHNLRNIQCNNNLLTAIDLCGTAATSLWAEDNPNLTFISIKNNVISTYDIARSTSIGTPPPLPSFLFPLSLTSLCYDEGERPAFNVGNNVTLSTDCQADCLLLSVNNIAYDNFSVHPNPASTYLNISGNTVVLSLQIFNTLGQIVKISSSSISNSSINIDVSTLIAGTYFIEINSNQGKTTKKFVKI